VVLVKEKFVFGGSCAMLFFAIGCSVVVLWFACVFVFE
jgi:hypothetical protein